MPILSFSLGFKEKLVYFDVQLQMLHIALQKVASSHSPVFLPFQIKNKDIGLKLCMFVTGV